MVHAQTDKQSTPTTTQTLPPLPIDDLLWHAVAKAMRLSPQYAKVVELVLRGMCDKQIAETMGIHKSTLRSYFERIALRTGASGRNAILRKVLTLSHQINR